MSNTLTEYYCKICGIINKCDGKNYYENGKQVKPGGTCVCCNPSFLGYLCWRHLVVTSNTDIFCSNCATIFNKSNSAKK